MHKKLQKSSSHINCKPKTSTSGYVQCFNYTNLNLTK